MKKIIKQFMTIGLALVVILNASGYGSVYTYAEEWDEGMGELGDDPTFIDPVYPGKDDPTPTPTPDPTPDPTPIPTPDPTPIPTPEPTPDPWVDPDDPTDPDDPEEPIDDPEVPTGAPGEPDVEIELDDPETPLGAPQTGDAANAAGMMALLVLAAAGLATTRRKFN